MRYFKELIQSLYIFFNFYPWKLDKFAWLPWSDSASTWTALRKDKVLTTLIQVPLYNKQIYLEHTPLKRKFLHRWSRPHVPRQSLTLHSVRPVRPTTLCCPFQRHNTKLFLLEMTSFADTPEKRLNIKTSASTAPWLAQINFKISLSIAVRLCFHLEAAARFHFSWMEIET